MSESKLLSQIQEIGNKAGFTSVGVALHDYETSVHFSHQGDVYFHAASTIKVAILFALFKSLEEGLVNLHDRLHVRNRFFSIIDHSVYQIDATHDADPDIYRWIGRSRKISELAYSMITRSSNLSTNLLLDYITLDGTKRFLTEAGVKGIKMERGVEDHVAFQNSLNNEANANGLVRLFKLFYEEHYFSKQIRTQILDILFAQEFNGMIPAKLPAGARVAHKTGEISTVCHDAGIVFLPERKPYVLAILTEFPANIETRHKPVAEISGLICDYLASL